MTYILYTCARSRGLRVSWTAAEIGIDLDYRMLSFPPRRTAPDYLKINPLGTVPTLLVGDTVLTESVGICHFLAEQHADGVLTVAKGERDRAEFLDFLYYADATITFPQTVFLRFAVFERDKGLVEAGKAYADWFGARLAKVEQRLQGRTYLAGDRFTVADICVGYALYLGSSVKLGRYLGPRASAYLEQLMSRPGWNEAIRRENEAAREQGVS